MKNVINIVNFIRSCTEPDMGQHDFVLPVKKQMELAYKYNFPMTFMYQYDAMVNPKFYDILKDNKDFEIGLWLECPKSLVEAAGLKWRGRDGYEWDHHSHVDMIIGYTPDEKMLLIDEAMRLFKEKFGYYPKSVGSWILDGFSINYMTEKYNIDAALICKEQWGTDGYSLWGGYYSEGYYPSKNNMLCPGQSDKLTVKTPVFRMLGTDPIRQYMSGLGKAKQSVESMEPSYPASGADKEWVAWFLNDVMNEKNIGFNYCQAGQENSFGWDAMKDGLLLQMELFKEKENNGEIEFLTVSETGKRYKEIYGDTPCTSTTSSYEGEASTWFNSKYYRASIYNNADMVYVRDIFAFNENYCERYKDKVCEIPACFFDNLPVIDSFRWSNEESIGGGYFRKNGKDVKAAGDISAVKNGECCLKVTVPTSEGDILVTFNEKSILFKFPDNGFDLDVRRYKNFDGPTVKIENEKFVCNHNSFDYNFTVKNAKCTVVDNGYKIEPNDNCFEIIF